jgi:hypothetical protein
MTVTFDTNTLDKAARPRLHPRDAYQAHYIKVNAALTTGTLIGYFSETVVTLARVQSKQKADVFNRTSIWQESETERAFDDISIIEIRSVMEQRRWKLLHWETAATIRAALEGGMKLLKAPPRSGMPRITDTEGKYFIADTGCETTNAMGRLQQASREIENRGAGIVTAKILAAQYSLRDKVQEQWFHSLGRTRDVHESNAVRRAIAEWADADAIAAHIGHDIDLFCTSDTGTTIRTKAVLNLANRAWLQETYGVNFVTISQLAEML